MMNYNIRTIKYKNNKVDYVPDFNDDSLEVLVIFLVSEVICFPKDIKEGLNNALTKRNMPIDFAGNICTLSIEDGIASLDYQLDEMMLDEPLKLPVEELNELVLKWISDVKELKAKETK